MTGPDANTQDSRPAVTTHPLLRVAMMFIGTFSVYLGGLLGPRRVLLACAWIFTAVSFLIPFCHSLEAVIALLIIAAEALGLQVRQQAYTLAISDSFLLLATCCVACLVVVSFMSKVPTHYQQITAAPVEAK
jgi:hypothetical protein